jgi:hypothetical protein
LAPGLASKKSSSDYSGVTRKSNACKEVSAVTAFLGARNNLRRRVVIILTADLRRYNFQSRLACPSRQHPDWRIG